MQMLDNLCPLPLLVDVCVLLCVLRKINHYTKDKQQKHHLISILAKKICPLEF